MLTMKTRGALWLICGLLVVEASLAAAQQACDCTGPPGPDGATGAAGATGAPGDAGDTGPMGPTGLPGPNGMPGTTGDTGACNPICPYNPPEPSCPSGVPHDGSFSTCQLGDWVGPMRSISFWPGFQTNDMGCSVRLVATGSLFQAVTGLEFGRYRLSACARTFGNRPCSAAVYAADGTTVSLITFNSTFSDSCPQSSSSVLCGSGCQSLPMCAMSATDFLALPSDSFFVALSADACDCAFDDICLSQESCNGCGVNWVDIQGTTSPIPVPPADPNVDSNTQSTNSDSNMFGNMGYSASVGIIVAAAVAAALAVFGAVYLIRRRRRRLASEGANRGAARDAPPMCEGPSVAVLAAAPASTDAVISPPGTPVNSTREVDL